MSRSTLALCFWSFLTFNPISKGIVISLVFMIFLESVDIVSLSDINSDLVLKVVERSTQEDARAMQME